MPGGRAKTRLSFFHQRRIFGVCFVTLLGGAGLSQGAAIQIPNPSFESPETVFVDVNIDSWQKSDKPDWYDESGGFLWTQLIGTFKNTAPGRFDHIENCDGLQAIWLFAVPEVSLLQDYNSVDWNDASPTHAFDSRYEAGKAYTFTAGVIGAGGGMSNGVTLQLSLYYRDAASNIVIVAATSITNSAELFGDRTHLIDFRVRTPAVKLADPWAMQHVGVRLLSTVSPELQGGYWDIDHIRLDSVLEPALLTPVWEDNQISFSLRSEPGLAFDILTSPTLTSESSSWRVLTTLTNVTGTTQFTGPAPSDQHGFFQLREAP